jgi:CRP/FNR family transcriptional regulator
MSLACAVCPVRDRAACSVLSDEQREALARSGRMREVAPGETLFAAGESNSVCATLVSGLLKVGSLDVDGRERILALVHPAGFVAELFAPFAHHDIVALIPSRVCLFARSNLQAAIEKQPQLGAALLRRSEEDLHRSREMVVRSARPALSRVAELLLALAEAASDSSCHPASNFDLCLSRGEMANLLGLTIETVSRAITRLERDGAVRRNGLRGIELLDPAHLKGLAD